MKPFFKSLLAGALLALAPVTTPVQASQGSACIATVGPLTGLELAQDINAALDALVSSNSGTAAPVTACSSASLLGQVWLDTNDANMEFKIYDGTSWLTIGTVNQTLHQWEFPPFPTQARISDGSAGVPGLGFTNETGTGLYRAGAGDLRIQVGGSTAVQITSSGIVNGSVPPGVIVPYAGTAAPTGWLLADGSCQLDATYPNLPTVLGTTYGSCSAGQTRLPDLRGRAVFGQDDMGGSSANRLTSPLNGDTLGATGGSEFLQQHLHAASASQGTHNHSASTASGGTHDHSYNAPLQGTPGAAAGGNAATGAQTLNSTTDGAHTHTVTVTASSAGAISVSTSNTGTGTAGNIPPAIILNYIIKY